ncbi:hypothetical protein ACP70R_006719 [Stipagrostis hirtigluma subsp. patula]
MNASHRNIEGAIFDTSCIKRGLSSESTICRKYVLANSPEVWTKKNPSNQDYI